MVHKSLPVGCGNKDKDLHLLHIAATQQIWTKYQIFKTLNTKVESLDREIWQKKKYCNVGSRGWTAEK